MLVPSKWFFASRLNLWCLVSIRVLVLTLQVISVVICYICKLFTLPWDILIFTFAASLILCLLTVIRLSYFSWPVSDIEYTIQLSYDLTIHSILLYCTGGATNPFVSYFLVPITIAAATLPWFYTLCLVGYAILGYSLLWVWNIPLHIQEVWAANSEILLINLHLVGMWLSFTFSTILIGFFVSQMAIALRQQDYKIAEWREEGLHDQQLLAVATQAAGAAHELGTPLSTMNVLLTDLQDTYRDDENLQEDLTLLQAQVQLCKESLQQLVRAAEAERLHDIKLQSVTSWLNVVLQRWHLMRPEVSYCYKCLEKDNEPVFRPHTTITQAVLNILNNAADACPEDIEIELGWDDKSFTISIHDKGSGIPSTIEDQLAKPFVSSKDKGFGLGLYLSQVSVIRAGGSLKLYNHSIKGTVALLQLPSMKNKI